METSLSSCGYICTDLDIPIAGEQKILLKRGKVSFYVMLDREIFTYLKNKK